jgi:hypothetical protein
MFRKIAIALVAASVFTAPVLAQTTPSDSKLSPSAPAASDSSDTVKTSKITKHRVVARHHRHGTKMVKYAKHGKYGKYTRHMRHGGTASKQISGARASVKPISKSKAKSGLD